jgi:ubiquinone/menaquinone biosynthesis C-methylase UbiE
MRRVCDDFLATLESKVSLEDMVILEIGSGDGIRSAELASRCMFLHGIEPDPKKLACANARKLSNAIFRQGFAGELPYPREGFHMVIFTLSLHHLRKSEMKRAIDEALRVVYRGGYVVFFEPTMNGSYFEAEVLFDIGCGDEREAKKDAHAAICEHAGLSRVAELSSFAKFEIRSAKLFSDIVVPKKNLEQLKPFLSKNNSCLVAERRLDIFRRP